VQIEDELAQIYREKEKIIIVVYGEEKQMLKFRRPQIRRSIGKH